jgi:hypothetical protein
MTHFRNTANELRVTKMSKNASQEHSCAGSGIGEFVRLIDHYDLSPNILVATRNAKDATGHQLGTKTTSTRLHAKNRDAGRHRLYAFTFSTCVSISST